MLLRPTQDNVLIVLEPEETETASGLQLVRITRPGARGHRTARVLAVGPGHFGRPHFRDPGGTFIPTQIKPGERVIVSAVAGQDYSLDLNVPRHNKGSDWDELLGTKGEFRVVREDEILCVIDKVEEGIAAE